MTELNIPLHLSPDRFQKGLHFVPQDKTDMVELTFEERYSLFLKLYPMSPGLNSLVFPSEKTDIFCAMENNRIPTHREKDVKLGYLTSTMPEPIDKELMQLRNQRRNPRGVDPIPTYRDLGMVLPPPLLNVIRPTTEKELLLVTGVEGEIPNNQPRNFIQLPFSLDKKSYDSISNWIKETYGGMTKVFASKESIVETDFNKAKEY